MFALCSSQDLCLWLALRSFCVIEVQRRQEGSNIVHSCYQDDSR